MRSACPINLVHVLFTSVHVWYMHTCKLNEFGIINLSPSLILFHSFSLFNFFSQCLEFVQSIQMA